MGDTLIRDKVQNCIVSETGERNDVANHIETLVADPTFDNETKQGVLRQWKYMLSCHNSDRLMSPEEMEEHVGWMKELDAAIADLDTQSKDGKEKEG